MLDGIDIVDSIHMVDSIDMVDSIIGGSRIFGNWFLIKGIAGEDQSKFKIGQHLRMVGCCLLTESFH